MKKIVITLSILLTLMTYAHADGSGVVLDSLRVSLSGLTVPCPNCSFKEDPCRLAVEGSATFLPCKQQLRSLLEEVVGSYRGEEPALSEIRSYLFSDSADPEVSSLVLDLLLQQEAGVRLFMTEGDFLFKENQEAIGKALRSGRADPLLAKGLWVSYQQGKKEMSLQMISAIATANSEVSVSELFTALQSQSEKSLTVLQDIEYLYRSSNRVVEAEQVSEAISYLNDCQPSSSPCETVSIEELPEPLAEYAKAISEKKLLAEQSELISEDPIKAIEDLEELSGGAVRSEEGQQLILEALRAARKEEFDTNRRKLVRPDMLENLMLTSDLNEDVARELAAILAKVSSESIETGEIRRSIVSLKQSLEIYPKVLESRSKLIIDLQTNSTIQGNTGAKAALDKLLDPKWRKAQQLKKLKAASKSEPRFPVSFILGFVVIAGLLWALTIFTYFRKQNSVAIEDREAKIEIDIWRKDRDRRHLRSFFELDEDSTEEELIANYRKMAKAIHPDTSGVESTEEFRELADLFQQARRLLFRK